VVAERLQEPRVRIKRWRQDIDVPPSAHKEKWWNVLGKRMTSAAETCRAWRMRKTQEELGYAPCYKLLQPVALVAREWLLENGTDKTGIRHCERRPIPNTGTALIMSDISVTAHRNTAVGIEMKWDVRTGRSTAYPHPNQFQHNKGGSGTSTADRSGVKHQRRGESLPQPGSSTLTEQMKKSDGEPPIAARFQKRKSPSPA